MNKEICSGSKDEQSDCPYTTDNHGEASCGYCPFGLAITALREKERITSNRED